MLQYPSINAVFNNKLTSGKRWKHLVRWRIPKSDAAIGILSKVSKGQLLKIHDRIVRKIRINKTMRGGTIDGYAIAAIDGVELFSSTKKACKECLKRELKNGTTEYFHRSVVCMTVGSDPHIILGQEMLHPRDGNEKDEGELTGGKRLMERLYKEHHHFADIIVADALYMKAPFVNCVLKNGMDVVIRVKEEKRLIVKDALGLFKNGYGRKESFKHKGISRIDVWDLDGFELTGVKRPMRFLQFIEYHGNEEQVRTVWVLTSSDANYKIIWKVIHKRWDIEENGFHQLKTYYHAKHCFSHKAVENIFILNIIAFNLREMYLYRRITGFRESKITRIEVSKKFDDDLLLYDMKSIFDSG